MVEKTKLDGVYIIKPKIFGDERGWFTESYNKKALEDELGFKIDFVQDNHSYSKYKNTIRGLHFQNNPFAQTKLVRCTRGALMDVCVDIRKNSPTYKQWVAVELSSENKVQLLVLKGFAHGFISLTDDCEIQYKTDAYYNKESDRSILYCDEELGIDWGITAQVTVSDKDKNAPLLKDSDCNFVY